MTSIGMFVLKRFCFIIEEAVVGAMLQIIKQQMKIITMIINTIKRNGYNDISHHSMECFDMDLCDDAREYNAIMIKIRKKC